MPIKAPAYRSLHRIHLPPPHEGKYIDKAEVVLFDGSTIVRADGAEIKLDLPSAIQAAIRAGWLVPVSSKETSFRPKSAGVEVRQAQSDGAKRGRVSVMTVQEEERDLGSIRKRVKVQESENEGEKVVGRVKTSAVPASPPRAQVTGKDGTKRMLVVEGMDESEGVVVGRVKNSAKSGKVDIGANEDRAIKDRLERSGPARIERVAQVEEGEVEDFQEEIEEEVEDEDGLEEVLGEDDDYVPDNEDKKDTGARVLRSGRTVQRATVAEDPRVEKLFALTEALVERLGLLEEVLRVQGILPTLEAKSETKVDVPSITPEAFLELHWKRRIAILPTISDTALLRAFSRKEASTPVKVAILARIAALTESR